MGKPQSRAQAGPKRPKLERTLILRQEGLTEPEELPGAQKLRALEKPGYLATWFLPYASSPFLLCLPPLRSGGHLSLGAFWIFVGLWPWLFPLGPLVVPGSHGFPGSPGIFPHFGLAPTPPSCRLRPSDQAPQFYMVAVAPFTLDSHKQLSVTWSQWPHSHWIHDGALTDSAESTCGKARMACN